MDEMTLSSLIPERIISINLKKRYWGNLPKIERKKYFGEWFKYLNDIISFSSSSTSFSQTICTKCVNINYIIHSIPMPRHMRKTKKERL